MIYCLATVNIQAMEGYYDALTRKIRVNDKLFKYSKIEMC